MLAGIVIFTFLFPPGKQEFYVLKFRFRSVGNIRQFKTAAAGTTLTFDAADDYANGIANTTASTFQVKSNRPWAVTVKAAAANFTGPATPSPAMPSAVLGVRLSTATAYSALSTTAVALTSGLRGDNNFSVDYKATPGFVYDAGTYTLSVVYTATQQ